MHSLLPSRTLIRYLAMQVPGWAVAVLLAWVLQRWYAVSPWAGLLMVGVWIVKDLAFFPRMRRFYEAESGEPHIVGDTGIAVTDLSPQGFVRVYGELWQAEAASSDVIPGGATVCVRDIRGLLLIVDPLPVQATPRPSLPASRHFTV